MPAVSATKYLVTASWEDAPHLSEEEKRELLESIPVFQRDARSRGIPQLGIGAVWPISEDRIKCEGFKIPEYWPVAYGLDVGWNNTAALWGAWDRASDTVYIWSEYKQGQSEPATHVDGIKARGSWIPGVIDPASRGRSQKDGISLLDEYNRMGLLLDIADNSVESGVHAVYRRFVSGRLKIFEDCRMFWDEFRLYRRGENGKIVKDNDHLCDCLRYLIVSGMSIAVDKVLALDNIYERRSASNGANSITGY
jgi:hypothetical protein